MIWEESFSQSSSEEPLILQKGIPLKSMWTRIRLFLRSISPHVFSVAIQKTFPILRTKLSAKAALRNLKKSANNRQLIKTSDFLIGGFYFPLKKLYFYKKLHFLLVIEIKGKKNHKINSHTRKNRLGYKGVEKPCRQSNGI